MNGEYQLEETKIVDVEEKEELDDVMEVGVQELETFSVTQKKLHNCCSKLFIN